MGQNITTPRGEMGFDNLEITMIFENGQRHTVRTCSGIDYGNNPKRGQIGGTQIGPVCNVGAKAEPACKIDGVGKVEAAEIRRKQGPGFYDQEVTVIAKYKRGAKPPIVDEVQGWQMNDTNVGGKPGEAMLKSFEGGCLKVIEDGIDPFAVDQDG